MNDNNMSDSEIDIFDRGNENGGTEKRKWVPGKLVISQLQWNYITHPLDKYRGLQGNKGQTTTKKTMY